MGRELHNSGRGRDAQSQPARSSSSSSSVSHLKYTLSRRGSSGADKKKRVKG
jgi:hypothetical protein